MNRQERKARVDTPMSYATDGLQMVQQQIYLVHHATHPFTEERHDAMVGILRAPSADLSQIHGVLNKLIIPRPTGERVILTDTDQLSRGFNEKLANTIRISYGMQRAAELEEGDTEMHARAQYMSSVTIERAGMILGVRQPNIAKLDGLYDAMDKLLDDPDHPLNSIAHKIRSFRQSVDMGSFFNDMILDIQEGIVLDEEGGDTLESIEFRRAKDLKQANDALFKETMETRRYAVEPRIMPSLNEDGIVHQWHVDSPDDQIRKLVADENDPIGRFLSSDNAVATFIGSTNAINEATVTYESDTSVPDGKAGEIRVDNNGDFIVIKLGTDGNLRSFYNQDLRDLVKAGQLSQLAYEQLRSEVLVLFADLVKPVWVKEKTKEVANPNLAGKIGKPDDSAERARVLVLAQRSVMHDNRERINKDVGASKRTLTFKGRRAGVVSLPDGHRPSSTALEAAERDGVTLYEGETYRRRSDVDKDGKTRVTRITSHADGTEDVVTKAGLHDPKKRKS